MRATSPYPLTADDYAKNLAAADLIKRFRAQVHGEVARLDAADRGEVVEELGPCRCYVGLGSLRGTHVCLRSGAHAGDEHGPRAFTEPCTPEGDPDMTTRSDGRLTDFFMTELHAGAIDDEELELLQARVVEARRVRDGRAAGAWRTEPLAPAAARTTTTTTKTDAIEVDPLDVDAARARRDAILTNAWKVPAKRSGA